MWLVSSASHLWGYRRYPTPDHTRNCWWVGLLAVGEGWHNNHHAYPSCAAHGRSPWELDLSFAYIRLIELSGLARDVKRPLERHLSFPQAAALDEVSRAPRNSLSFPVTRDDTVDIPAASATEPGQA